MDYGMKEENPIDKVRFYSKRSPNEAMQVRQDQVNWQLLSQKKVFHFLCVKAWSS